MHTSFLWKCAVIGLFFLNRSFQQTFIGEERLRDEPKDCLCRRLIIKKFLSFFCKHSVQTLAFVFFYRDNYAFVTFFEYSSAAEAIESKLDLFMKFVGFSL